MEHPQVCYRNNIYIYIVVKMFQTGVCVLGTFIAFGSLTYDRSIAPFKVTFPQIAI